MGRKTITCRSGVLTQIDADVITTIRFQNNDCVPVYIIANDTADEPADPTAGAVMLRPLDTIPAQGVDALFPDVGLYGYLWLLAKDTAQVSVSYV